MNNQLILASASPRRKELLGLLGADFTVKVSAVEEIITKQEPGEIVEELSRQKACAVADGEETGWIIGADTLVFADGRVLGKPKDEADAREMLRALAGKTHSVFTGVTIACKQAGEQVSRSFHAETKVQVHELTEEEISWYLSTGEPFDKAGSYGIQGAFAAFVDGICGDYQNVVGLPVSLLYQNLKEMGWTR